MIFCDGIINLINIKTCIHYQGTVVQKLLATGQSIQILGQKIEKEGLFAPPETSTFNEFLIQIQRYPKINSLKPIWLYRFHYKMQKYLLESGSEKRREIYFKVSSQFSKTKCYVDNLRF